MISETYRQLKEIADKEFSEIIEDSGVILSYTGKARKLRLKLIDGTFADIWYSHEGEYSYHWEQTETRNKVYRHDNSPHLKWSYVKTFPKHCHDGNQEHVVGRVISPKNLRKQ
ncbi:MAG: hypothetical protein C4538_10585 [Nitrospiraceae bacterium]|nr:MAG: hypothetical protein C4538_10585 [Nitrospiraceae bacterium]